jgi:hypothetical protein
MPGSVRFAERTRGLPLWGVCRMIRMRVGTLPGSDRGRTSSPMLGWRCVLGRRRLAGVCWILAYSVWPGCSGDHAGPQAVSSGRRDAGSERTGSIPVANAAGATPSGQGAQGGASSTLMVQEAGAPSRVADSGALAADAALHRVTPDSGRIDAPDTGPRPAPRPLIKLSLDFTTEPGHGLYSPHNVGAAWIEDTNGKWLHTLEYWGSGLDADYLVRYVAAGGPAYASPGSLLGLTPPLPRPPDLISSATLTVHQAHLGDSWNCRDANGMQIADGAYRAVVEFYEVGGVLDASIQPHPTVEVPFEVGAQPLIVTPPDSAYFASVKLTLE